MRPATLLDIARRNEVRLPAETVEDLADLYRFRDFAHFIEVWQMTTAALRSADDFRRVVVDYAEEAADHGAVYVEGIFSPAEPAARGVRWEEVFEGYCDGAQQARELHGVEVRLTPDVPRGFPLEAAAETARQAVAYRERGVVGLGLGGPEAEFPPELYADAFAIARDGGLASVPHAGEAAGPASIQGALESLEAHRLRHGIRAVEDPGLVRELAGRGTVLDVCPISNLRTGVVGSIEDHPLPKLVGSGVRCSLSTDDPAMFDTDLGREHEVAVGLGLSPRDFYDAGVEGALCDDATRAELRRLGELHAWDSVREGDGAHVRRPLERGAGPDRA